MDKSKLDGNTHYVQLSDWNVDRLTTSLETLRVEEGDCRIEINP